MLPIKRIDVLYSLHTVMAPIYGSSATARDAYRTRSLRLPTPLAFTSATLEYLR